MFKKSFLYFGIFFAVFVGLVFYNSLKAQQAVRETRPSIFLTEIVSAQDTVKLGERARFVWKVIAPSDLYTSYTTIFYGEDSTPSALHNYDSPQAVGYPLHLPDYESGRFKLPDSFDLDLIFPKKGRFYFRSYAKVGDQHLWSEERMINVD